MKHWSLDSSNTMKSVLHRILSICDFEVAEADNSQHAIDVLRAMGAAGLVLVNWCMHNIEGLEFVTRLRQEIVIVTRVVRLVVSQQGMRELQGARIAGPDDHLMKPFTALQIDEKPAKVGLACGL